jgi:hypothetical protein
VEKHKWQLNLMIITAIIKNMAGVIAELEKIIGKIEASTPLIPRRRGTLKSCPSSGSDNLQHPPLRVRNLLRWQ